MEPFYLFDDPSQIKLHVGLVGAAEPVFARLKESALFAHVIMDNRVIGQSKRSNTVSTVSFSHHPVKEFCVAIAKFELSDSAAFPPVSFFALQQVK